MPARFSLPFLDFSRLAEQRQRSQGHSVLLLPVTTAARVGDEPSHSCLNEPDALMMLEESTASASEIGILLAPTSTCALVSEGVSTRMSDGLCNAQSILEFW